MPNICVACSISNHHPVTAALFTLSSNPVTGDVIYYLPSPTANAQHSYHRGGYLSPTTGIGTAFALPNLYTAVLADHSANYGGDEHSPYYIPSGP
ncbi:unnamed protein product [marine sediment metagenome]|uniref:Uncharacterized protein n=1 Tax=marine sediment metagenome TaxID=412755 RepID=X1MFQ4_9ZZZZ